MLASKIAVLLTLAYASYSDFRSHTVHDKVFLYGSVGVLAPALFTETLPYVGSMLVQGFVAVLILFFLQLFKDFGTADIWAIALASTTFPEVLIFYIFGIIFFPALLWIRFYCLVTRRNRGPAIPGLLIGYLFLLIVYGI